MKIYSIKEIVKVTNKFLNPKHKTLTKKNNKQKKTKLLIKTKNIIPPETEKIIISAEKSIIEDNENLEAPLLLKNEVSTTIDNKINHFNYKFKIKPEIKDRMVNELYLYLKKKVKKNTLKLIIDEQVEIKNLKNKINILKQNENKLVQDYQILKNNYFLAMNNYEKLKINRDQLDTENNELKINNKVLNNNLTEATQNIKELNIEKEELKVNYEVLQNNLNHLIKNEENLKIKNKDLKNDLDEKTLNLNETKEKNRSYEINNAELKNTLSRYINNSKNLQEKLNLNDKSINSKLEEESKKVKFYQEENIRLSSELLSVQKNNETIKDNLNFIETEKEKISNKIKELNKSIEGKTNIISSSFTKEKTPNIQKDIDELNDKEQKSLDEIVNKIFSKI